MEVVAINISRYYSLGEWRNFWKDLRASEVTWAHDISGSAVRTYNVQTLGTTVIIDRRGQVMYRDDGPTSYTILRAEIEKLL